MNQFTNIPEELKQLPQWVCRKEKIPFNPVTGSPAKAGQPTTWARFENAVNAYENGGYDGIGFEFNKNGVVGIDLDHVIADDGSLSTEAVEIVVMLNSYTEYSPSGKGLHIFVKGNIPVDGRKKGFIEMYKAKRYFTVTGNVYGKLKPINERPEEVIQIFNEYFTKSVSVNLTMEANIDNSCSNTGKDYLSIGLSKDAVFKALWNDEYQSEKCTSESEADLALMGKLLYWCSGNADAAIEAFKGSPYAKGKDDNHTAKIERSDYLQRTVKKAMQGLTSTAVSDDEKFIKKFAKGTAEIQETLKHLQPQIKYACDDKGNGELFADVFSSIARFNVTANEWFVYDGRVWLKDVGAMLVSRMAKQLKDELMMFSVSIDNETQKTAYQKHILKMGSRAVRETMVKDARDKYCISNEDLDKDLDLLNLQNGTLNLKTLEFREIGRASCRERV